MNLKKVAYIIDAKYKLSINKIHMSGNLSNMNENIAFEAKKLKRKGDTHAWFKKESIVHIKLGEQGESIKIFHKSYFKIHCFDYKDKEKDFSHDVSKEISDVVQPSYWENYLLC